MKLELEALSPAEGIGIIRSGQTLRLVRPPYTRHDAPALSEESLQDAILRHGFSAFRQQFQTWEDAIIFLNQQAAITRRSLGKEVPIDIPGPEIFDVAPPEVLDAFLDRIERETIPRRRFDHAEDFLLALLRSKACTRQPSIVPRAAGLLQRNNEARRSADAGMTELASRDIRFPNLAGKPDDLARSVLMTGIIRERGCVFA